MSAKEANDNKLYPLPSADQSSSALSITTSTLTFPFVVRLALFPITAYVYGAITWLVCSIGWMVLPVPAMPSSIPFKATASLPEFHNSNQRVVLLVAADGLIMISENFKSSTPSPFTTIVICHPKKSNPIQKKRVIVLFVDAVICRLQTMRRMDRVVRESVDGRREKIGPTVS
jgi:hypothetical protein